MSSPSTPLIFPAGDHIWTVVATQAACLKRLTAMPYAFHVRRKETGAWETKRAVHEGDPPKPNDVIEANLNGKIVKARVLVVISALPDREGEGNPAVEVHATEI